MEHTFYSKYEEYEARLAQLLRIGKISWNYLRNLIYLIKNTHCTRDTLGWRVGGEKGYLDRYTSAKCIISGYKIGWHNILCQRKMGKDIDFWQKYLWCLQVFWWIFLRSKGLLKYLLNRFVYIDSIFSRLRVDFRGHPTVLTDLINAYAGKYGWLR